MRKLHILLVENCETQIEFFTNALNESGLGFICSTAKSMEQALRILRNIAPDAVFIDTHIALPESITEFKKLKSAQRSAVIYFSVLDKATANPPAVLEYVQLPGNIKAMARILKNLFNDHYKYDMANA